MAGEIHDLAIKPNHERKLTTAQPDSTLCYRIKDRLHVCRRAGNNPQHFGSRRLLLQRLPQLVEQPRVLYGDDGLGSEVLEQFKLFVGEWPNFFAVDLNGTDQLLFLKHRHISKRTHASHVDETDGPSIAMLISRVLFVISNMH